MATNETPYDLKVGYAAKWYEVGQPTWEVGDTTISIVDRIDFDRLDGLWQSIQDERREHAERAERYAVEKAGSWSSDAGLVLQKCEYERLEAAAAERRILALAACIK